MSAPKFTPEHDDLIRVMWVRGVGLGAIRDALMDIGGGFSLEQVRDRVRMLLNTDKTHFRRRRASVAETTGRFE